MTYAGGGGAVRGHKNLLNLKSSGRAQAAILPLPRACHTYPSHHPSHGKKRRSLVIFHVFDQFPLFWVFFLVLGVFHHIYQHTLALQLKIMAFFVFFLNVSTPSSGNCNYKLANLHHLEVSRGAAAAVTGGWKAVSVAILAVAERLDGRSGQKS